MSSAVSDAADASPQLQQTVHRLRGVVCPATAEPRMLLPGF